MTTRHGLSSSFRPLRRFPPSYASHSRGFSASRRYLKQHDPEGNDISLKDTDYDYRKPCDAAHRNCMSHPNQVQPNFTMLTKLPSDRKLPLTFDI